MWIGLLASLLLVSGFRYDEQWTEWVAPNHFLVVCAKVSREEAHLVEWIEFHRIQGVEKFVLYYEAPPLFREASLSASHLFLLKDFYDQRGLSNLIELHPVGSVLFEGVSPTSYAKASYADYHRTGQIAVYKDCLERYREKAEWVGYMDADEFMIVPHDKDDAMITATQYFHTIGYQHYRRDLNLTYPGAPNLPPHPPADAIALFNDLYNQDVTEWMQYMKNETLDGLFVPSITYGSGGQFWEFNDVLARDPISGITNLYFDPRDHLKFNTTWSKLSVHDRKAFDTIPHHLTADVWETNLQALDNKHWPQVDWDKSATDRLNLLTEELFDHLLNTTDEMVLDFFESRLQADYHNDMKLPLMPPMDPEDVEGLTRRRDFIKLVIERYHTSAQGGSLEREKLLDRLYQAWSELWADYYPLIVDMSVFRQPAYLTGEPLSLIYDVVEANYPQCKEYLDAQREQDTWWTDPTGGYVDPPTLAVEAPHPMCKVGRYGPAYTDVTQMGKTFYWTGEWIRREARVYERELRAKNPQYVSPLVKNPQPENHRERELAWRYNRTSEASGCHLPWIHYCGWRTPLGHDGTVSRLNPLYEMRINHHSQRSFMKRSLGYPKWRKSHIMGYVMLRGNSTAPWEKFANSHRDDAARRWAKMTKDAIRQLHPLPKFQSLKLDREAHAVSRSGIIQKCETAEVLAESRSVCPASHPHVGLAMPKSISPPSPVILGGYCVNGGESTDLKQMIDSSEIVMCPGWPETSCCDFDSHYIDTSYKHRNLTVWKGGSVCVHCAAHGA